ncbi:hypothetical protein N9W89_01320 [Hellea sp.]|nr:hypothetical protein [Hellea sp.]
MFRALVLSGALLAGCQSNTKSETRSVIVFENIPSIKTKTISRSDCVWEKVELSIFNQTTEFIQFEYHKCLHEGSTKFEVKNGNEVFGIAEEAELHILTVWNTSPYGDEEFVKSLIPEDARDKCILVQDENSNWKIGLNELDTSFQNGWVMYPPLNDSIPKYSDINELCGPYGYNPGNDWVVGVQDGIGVAYSEMMELMSFYDLNSITYESRH